MSPRAAWRLEHLGFSTTYNYVGSKMDWIGEGLPFEGTLADQPRLSTQGTSAYQTSGNFCRGRTPLALFDDDDSGGTFLALFGHRLTVLHSNR